MSIIYLACACSVFFGTKEMKGKTYYELQWLEIN